MNRSNATYLHEIGCWEAFAKDVAQNKRFASP
jgi:hypothetical protein